MNRLLAKVVCGRPLAEYAGTCASVAFADVTPGVEVALAAGHVHEGDVFGGCHMPGPPGFAKGCPTND
jgi:hypothetical protein